MAGFQDRNRLMYMFNYVTQRNDIEGVTLSCQNLQITLVDIQPSFECIVHDLGICINAGNFPTDCMRRVQKSPATETNVKKAPMLGGSWEKAKFAFYRRSSGRQQKEKRCSQPV